MRSFFNNYWSNSIQTNSSPKDQNKINNANEFKLSEGHFYPDEAREIVINDFFVKYNSIIIKTVAQQIALEKWYNCRKKNKSRESISKLVEEAKHNT